MLSPVSPLVNCWPWGCPWGSLIHKLCISSREQIEKGHLFFRNLGGRRQVCTGVWHSDNNSIILLINIDINLVMIALKKDTVLKVQDSFFWVRFWKMRNILPSEGGKKIAMVVIMVTKITVNTPCLPKPVLNPLYMLFNLNSNHVK